MVRLNVILIVLVLASALALVSAQHQSRKLFIELERLQTRERALEVPPAVVQRLGMPVSELHALHASLTRLIEATQTHPEAVR